MFYIDETNKNQHCYVTYGRQFLRYRWYKPIFVAVTLVFFYLLLLVALFFGLREIGMVSGISLSEIIASAASGYDDLNVNNFFESTLNLGTVALLIPALFLARLVVRDRPFSSYSSSRGGWNSGLFFRYLGICIITVIIPIVIHDYFTEGFEQFDIKFTLAGFIALLILGPLQCIAEEYVFRGLLMQTFGSWFRIPVIAVILQSAVFALAHPYNWIGKCAILASGIGFGMAAWIGRGIELSSAIHVANNMTVFIMSGLGLTHVATDVSVDSLIFDICMYSANVIILLILSKKTDWFNKGRKDDLAIANEKEQARRDRKAAKAAKKNGPASTDQGIDFTSAEPVKAEEVKVEPFSPEPEVKVQEVVEAYDVPENTQTRTGGRVQRNKDKY